MRKEVKLGMGLGAGLVALLVAYLVVAPPSDHKRGVQLVTSDGGSIIDPTAQSGGGDGSVTPAVEQMTKVSLETPAAPKADTHPLPQQPVEQPKGPKAVDRPATAGGATAGKDPWGILNGNGEKADHQAKPQQRQASEPVASAPAKAAEKPAKETEKHEVKVAAKETRVVAEARPRTKQVYYFDPNGAYGDGLSTDGLAAAVERSMKATPAPKATHAMSAPAESTTKVELGSPAATPTAGSTHVVRSGETFSSIAAAVYGSAAYYPHLIRANPHANPNNLKLGTVIQIPRVEDVKATSGSGESRPARGAALAVEDDVKIDSTRQYKVVPGDSLYKISQKVYGKPTYLEAIYEKNKQLIGPNPTKLKLGMVLELPERAGGGSQ